MAEGKITYYAKNPTICPLCDCAFHREELLTGGGRMNAGELTRELRRTYLPTQRYGQIYPLIYPVSVCPQCWFAAYPSHFDTLAPEEKEQLMSEIGQRKNMLRPVFPNLDFEKERGLEEGIASYVLAALCYEHRNAEYAPTFMRGLSFLRAGWLANDLHAVYPEENYNYMARIYLRKASFFYGEVLECERDGTETLENIPHHGPDIDNNYGYDGVLYLVGILLLQYGQRDNPARRVPVLKEARAAVSRLVGMGKSTKAKPSALLDLGRDLHKMIKKELEALTGEA